MACWDEAAQRYHINPRLLYAIAKCESGLRPGGRQSARTARAPVPTTSGSCRSIRRNLQRLSAYGIGERQLYDACTNIQVGAWILADKIQRHGLSWEAVGAYNAACTELKGNDCEAARSKYAWCVYRNLRAAAPGSTSPRAIPRSPARIRVPIIATRVAP